MQLRRLEVRNFGMLRDIGIDFEESVPVTLIVGAHGSGKTTLLRAIAWGAGGTGAATAAEIGGIPLVNEQAVKDSADGRATVEVSLRLMSSGSEITMRRSQIWHRNEDGAVSGEEPHLTVDSSGGDSVGIGELLGDLAMQLELTTESLFREERLWSVDWLEDTASKIMARTSDSSREARDRARADLARAWTDGFRSLASDTEGAHGCEIVISHDGRVELRDSRGMECLSWLASSDRSRLFLSLHMIALGALGGVPLVLDSPFAMFGSESSRKVASRVLEWIQAQQADAKRQALILLLPPEYDLIADSVSGIARVLAVHASEDGSAVLTVPVHDDAGPQQNGLESGTVAGEPIERVELEAQRLFDKHPPKLTHVNKRAVFEIACPPGCLHSGSIVYSRWLAAGLPLQVDPAAALGILEVRPNVYNYEPVPDLPGAVEWHVNFADPELFAFYGGGLFAQDELQCAEHPVLGALREALLAQGRATRTFEAGRPTPVLVAGAERRCSIATDPDPAHGRSAGLYGSQFAAAPADAVRSAATRIDPPTTSNVIAIAAPAYGSGLYRQETIREVLETAYTGFRAAEAESALLAGAAAPVVVHTGFWGCGAFGGNRVLMTMLQLLAAEAAGIDRLVFHTVRADGGAPVDEAQAHFREALGSAPLGTEEAVERIVALGLEWGTGNGT